MTAPSLPKAVLPVISSSTLTGCSLAGAPSFDLFGAFFPAWMFCALIGIVAAASARVVLTSPRLNDAIPWQLAVCTAVGVIVALLAWMLLFR
jgi:YtcA family